MTPWASPSTDEVGETRPLIRRPLIGHAEGPRAATGDTSRTGQPKPVTRDTGVSRSPAREPIAAVGRHRPDRTHDDSDGTLTGRCPRIPRRPIWSS